MVLELSDMLNTAYPLYADTSGAKRNLKIDMACKLKEHLFSIPDTWYYTAAEKAKVLIIPNWG
jgi:hypothetical protein